MKLIKPMPKIKPDQKFRIK